MTQEVPSSSSAPSPFPDEQERQARFDQANVPEDVRQFMGPHGAAPLPLKLGIRFVEMTPDRMVATMPVAGNEQNVGLLHGGAHFVLAETLGSLAAVLHVRLNLGLDRHTVVGTELGATHHRGVRQGIVTGTCTPLNLGRQLTSHEIVMTDEEGRRLSTARMTNMILPPRE